MKKQYVDQIEQIFKSESLRGEKIHLKVNWVVFIIVLLMSYFAYFIQHNEAGKYGVILASVCLVYNLISTIFIYKKKSSPWVSYSTIFLNMICITFYNYIDACNNSTIVVATSASLLIYPAFIFLSALRMDKYLIIWTATLAIISMNGLYIWFYHSFDPYIVEQMISTDPFSQGYRTIYLILISISAYSVPKTMRRVLKMQEELVIENFENKHIAQHDALTGLYNRLYFEQYLSGCIDTSKRLNHKFALLYIDLDGFKVLNDTYGHELGDFTLKVVAEDLLYAVREDDMIARVGGDEFIIVMPDIWDFQEVEAFSHRILSAIKEKRIYGNIEFSIEASIGISLYPQDSENRGKLIKYADEAMYKVKKSGKKGVMFYKEIKNHHNKEKL
jgi:diguanylate cyclase (GGDEF)-like protein